MKHQYFVRMIDNVEIPILLRPVQFGIEVEILPESSAMYNTTLIIHECVVQCNAFCNTHLRSSDINILTLTRIN